MSIEQTERIETLERDHQLAKEDSQAHLLNAADALGEASKAYALMVLTRERIEAIQGGSKKSVSNRAVNAILRSAASLYERLRIRA